MFAQETQKVTGTTEVYGIIGDPIRHTLSPAIHNTLAELLGENLTYVPFPLEKCRVSAETGSDMQTVLAAAHALGIRGMNVTVPYKEAVIPCLALVDPLAERIGAVNTLRWTEEGYVGYNTDLPGLRRALSARFSGEEGKMFTGRKAVVLGAGGAARSVLMLLLLDDVQEIRLFNRSPEKAEKLASEMNAKFTGNRVIPMAADAYHKLPAGEYIFFQCTSLGLKTCDGLLIEDEAFYRNAVFGYDLIYNPAETPFTKLLGRLGIPVENGLSMLLYQGIIAHEIWKLGYNEENKDNRNESDNVGIAAKEQKRKVIPQEICGRVMTTLKRELYGENLVLIGYMGAGKTSVGKTLAEKTGRAFIDTDELIVEKAGMTIPEIFDREGETGFRNMETSVLEELRNTVSHAVIATGGGAVLKSVNRKYLMETGKTFFLSAEDETVYQRVGTGEGRPLLSGTDELLSKIQKMQKERRPYYESAAAYSVITDQKSVEEITDEILKIFTESNGSLR